jgi:hypothetical protein
MGVNGEIADIAKRLIGSSAICSPKGEVTDVDVNGLVRRLLLFDRYVLISVRLQEFPHLVKYLGYEGLRDLLFARLIEVRCECLQVTNVAQSGLFGDRVLPAFTYRFNWIDAHDKQKYIEDGLKGIEAVPGLRNRQIRVLKEAIHDSIRPLPPDARSQLWPAFVAELHNAPLLRTSVQMVLRKRLGRDLPPFSLSLHRESDELFRVDTNLPRIAGLEVEQAHRIVEAGLMGVAGLSQAIGEMKAYSALSGFRDDDLPLFRKKLEFLAGVASSETSEARFQRVIEIADLPETPFGSERVNVDRLLKIRDTGDVREFRDWLAGCGGSGDEEIRERVSGLRAKVGLKAASGTGKAVRFLVTNALGFIPHHGPIIGLAAGLADSFLLDRIIPRSGIAAFVNELYPSIFETREKP